MPLFVPGERLGGTELTTAAANTAIVGPFAPYKYLTIYACVSGYASSGIFSLRFGTGTTAAVDSTTLYRDNNMPGPTTAVATWGTAAVGASQTMMRLANAGITGGRMSTIEIMNRSSTIHQATWMTANEGNATTQTFVILGNGSYTTASAAQITCVQMVTSGGNLNAGTGFVVYGHNQL